MDDFSKVMKSFSRAFNGLKMILEKLEHKPIDCVMYEIDTLKSFVKFKSNALDNTNKVLCSFVQFDAKTKASEADIDIFVSIPDMLLLSNDILSGKINQLAQIEKKKAAAENNNFPREVYSSPLGGVNETNARERKLRTDGKAISRLFKIVPGSKADFVFIAEQKPAHSDKRGLIVPEKCPPEKVIRVACSAHDLKCFALMVKAHIEGYISARYATNGYARKDK